MLLFVSVFAVKFMKETVNIPCASGASLPLSSTKYEWRRLGPASLVISKNIVNKYHVNGSNGDLVIEDVQDIDSGRYYCIVTYAEDKKIVFIHHLVG